MRQIDHGDVLTRLIGQIFNNSELRFGKQKVIMSAVIVSFDLS